MELGAAKEVDLDAGLTTATVRWHGAVAFHEQHELSFDRKAVADFHFIHFDANDEPVTSALGQFVADHLLFYVHGYRRDLMLPDQVNEYQRRAREFLRERGYSGEPGEALLYAILDAYYGAPQVIAKVELKTNPSDETHGSDGIHARVAEDGAIDLYFGEAKLFRSVSKAIDSALDSLVKFQEKKLQNHELNLVTRHVRDFPDNTKQALIDYARGIEASKTFRHNHAIFIGFDWQRYQSLVSEAIDDIRIAFQGHYEKRMAKLVNLAQDKLDSRELGPTRLHFIFLPFTDVDEFRISFFNAVGLPHVAMSLEEEE